jgi:hypothetical protein
MGGMSDCEAGDWGRPGLPQAFPAGSLHEGSDLVIDGDHDGDRWSVSGGYLAVGPDGLHLAPGVTITGSWMIRGPGLADGGGRFGAAVKQLCTEPGTSPGELEIIAGNLLDLAKPGELGDGHDSRPQHQQALGPSPGHSSRA